MTLLVDPPLLVAGGYAIGAVLNEPRKRRVAATALGVAFLVPSASIYLNAPIYTAFWEATGAASGKDLILNSWVLRFPYDKPSVVIDLIAGAIFATYPAWALLGAQLGARRRARKIIPTAVQS